MHHLTLIVPSFDATRTETISTDFYRRVCDCLIKGGRVSGPIFNVQPEIRDRCGFCYVKDVTEGPCYFVGFTDNPHRPGVFIQKSNDLTFPRGNTTVQLPSKTKVTLPNGCFLVDAEVFDEMLAGWTITAELP